MNIDRTELLQMARAGVQKQLEEIDAELRQIALPRHGMSFAGRQRVAEAQRKRWATRNVNNKPAKKRKMSAEGKKRIADAARKRWKEFREQKQLGAGA